MPALAPFPGNMERPDIHANVAAFFGADDGRAAA